MNKSFVLGNLTRDVELKYTPSGTAVTDVTVAVNERKKNASGDWEEVTTFVDCTLWGRTAEIAHQYLGKGSKVLIEGRLTQDTWQDKETGKNRSKLKITCEKLEMLGSKGERQNQSDYSAQQQNSEPDSTPEDDIPF